MADTTTPQDIADSDINLMHHVCGIVEEQRCGDFISEVFRYPAFARERINGILDCRDDLDFDYGFKKMSKNEYDSKRSALRDELYRVIDDVGGEESTADAFFMERRAWYATHVVNSPEYLAAHASEVAAGIMTVG
jgi:hypothetical protein